MRGATFCCFSSFFFFFGLVDGFSSVPGPRRIGLTNQQNRPLTVLGSTYQENKEDILETTPSSKSSSPFDDFDYEEHWYPVIWAQDVPLNEPTKVTVFDTDFVVARTSEDEVICMQDRCPHKAASLSQGRVTETGNIQCSYHGWAFNGKTGECVNIPQITPAPGETSGAKIPSRACGDAVPAQVHQGMIWIFPGGGLEKALKADPPPTVDELDQPGFKHSTSIRDFPVDWPILVSNICDPDHGPFAHQAKPFDMYTASSPEFPMEITEEFPNNGKGWVIKSKVDASEKLLKVDKKWREDRGDKLKKKKGKDEKSPWATTYIHAPTHIRMKRVDKTTGTANFATTFFVCPVGVGRSRFMSAAVGKSSAPRWITKLFLDNFLDQDTYLLATQQQYLLDQEARDVKELLAAQNGESPKDITKATLPTRRKLFCLPSPTEKLGSRLEKFWDSTLLRSPNRIERLLQLHEAGAFASTPSREYVLDRKSQLLDICPDARDVVTNCKRVTFFGKWVGLGALAAKLFLWSNKRVPLVTATSAVCFLAAFLANKLRKEYYFKYTDEMRQKDLNNIPKQIWIDK